MQAGCLRSQRTDHACTKSRHSRPASCLTRLDCARVDPYQRGIIIDIVSSYEDVSRDGLRADRSGDESIVMPGLVDTHVHINEPGRTEWEGFATATRAAAAGGVTTLVDMPLNSIPPTTTVAGFKEKLAAARGQCYVDVGFWGGVVPGNTSELAALSAAGVVGFKCFLIRLGRR